MYKKYYQDFLTKNSGIQNFRRFSPDYWADSSPLVQLESNEQMVFDTQKLIAHVLNLSNPKQIVFSSGPEELLHSLCDSFSHKKMNILTTDSESFNFDEQKFTVIKVETSPFDDFKARFIEKINETHYDFIFFSQVFFNSGMVVDQLQDIVDTILETDTKIVIDGRQAFMTIPTNLLSIESRVFYLSGSRDLSFLHIPESFLEKCRYKNLLKDRSGLHHLHSVLSLFQKDNLTVERIHSHIKKLQTNFREHLLTIDHSFLTEKNIISVNYDYHGSFFSFAMPSLEHAKKLHSELYSKNIWTEYHLSRLHFGFGLYQEDCIDLKSMIKC